jgi:hypothetical protein
MGTYSFPEGDKNPAKRPEVREKLRKTSVDTWKDPMIRAKRIAGMMRGVRDSRKCVYLECGRVFECLSSSSQRYCSRKCCDQDKIGRPSKKRLPRRKKICARKGCNNTFVCKITSKQKYCCVKCVPTSEEAKQRMRKPHPSIRGENNPSWAGGMSTPYPSEFNNEFKELVRERYNYTCMVCKRKQGQLERKLDVHHIDYDKDNLNVENK